jgi:hypothetical protein
MQEGCAREEGARRAKAGYVGRKEEDIDLADSREEVGRKQVG